MTEERRPGRQDGIEVAPTRLGAPRRGPDPLPIVVAIAAVALGLAVIKPWDAGPSGIAVADPTPVATAAVSPPTATASREPADSGPTAADDGDLLAAVSPRQAWGVLAIADPTPADALTTEGTPETGWRPAIEHWVATVPGATTSQPTAAAAAHGTPRAPAVIRSDTPVRLLGVTAPLARTPLAIRAWRARGESWRWVATAPPLADHPAAHRLLRLAAGAGEEPAAWPPGRYRLDLLLGTSIVSMELRLAAPEDDAPSFAGPRPAPGLFDAPGGPLAGLEPARLGGGPVAYAVVGGRAVPLDARPTVPLDPAAVWLDPDDAVARLGARGVRALGVALPAGAREVAAGLRRLAPSPLADPAPGTPGPVTITVPAGDGGRPIVEASPPSGGAWASGTYALDVTWTTDDGPRSGTWHIELHPGVGPDPTVPLAAARSMAALAGTPGFLVPRPQRLGMEAGSDAVARFPLGTAIDCASARVDEPPAALGVALEADQVVLEAVADRTRSGGGTAPVGLRIVPVGPGLTLLLPRDTVHFRAGIHTVRLAIGPAAGTDEAAGIGTTSVETSICLGVPPFDR